MFDSVVDLLGSLSPTVAALNGDVVEALRAEPDAGRSAVGVVVGVGVGGLDGVRRLMEGVDPSSLDEASAPPSTGRPPRPGYRRGPRARRRRCWGGSRVCRGQITAVAHAGRTIPAHLRTALEARDPVCIVPGCEVRLGLEIDHRDPWSATRDTSLANTARLCTRHHYQKSVEGYRYRGGPGTREWIAPDEPSEPPTPHAIVRSRDVHRG